MALFDWLLGRPLATAEEDRERVGVMAGIPMLGLDALASAAYGPEAALTILMLLGTAGTAAIGPITLLIVGLLFLVYLSYRQTIAAYPHGGGSYTVAKDNLGVRWGLLAAAALMIDYVLTVAVGISAGVGALVSAIPELQSYTLVLCLATLGTDYHDQSARSQGIRRRLRHTNLPVHSLAAWRIGRRRHQSVCHEWSSDARCSAAYDTRPGGNRQPLAARQSLRQRLHRDDRR
jgi:hypothetical protein